MLYLSRKIVSAEDIGQSYDRVSSGYEKYFLETMHSYNDELLGALTEHFEKSKTLAREAKDLKILDLAAGTGYNSRKLSEIFPKANFTLVDISPAMLKEAKKNWGEGPSPNFVIEDMLTFLKNTASETYDIIVCAWALKYQTPKKIIKHIKRVLKPNGFLGVIINRKNTLPQIAKIYPKLLAKHPQKINKLMLPLPNPKNLKAFDSWFTKESFSKIISKEGTHHFHFQTSRELVEFVTSTGALAGFDIMLDLRDPEVKSDLQHLLEKNRCSSVHHKFLYGVYKKQQRNKLYE